MTTSGFVPLAFLWPRGLMESNLPLTKENRALGLLRKELDGSLGVLAADSTASQLSSLKTA